MIASKKTGWRNRIIGHGDEPLDQIMFNPANWRIHPKAQQDALEGVLSEVGWVQDVIVNKRTGNLIDGHLRCQIAARNEEQTIPVVYVDLSEDEEAIILASLDPLAAMAATDKAKLEELLRAVHSDDERVQQMMSDLAGRENIIDPLPQSTQEQARTTLSERFIVPPFSVLDARQGYWQERKRAWIGLGIQSELGRGENLNEGQSSTLTDLSGRIKGWHNSGDNGLLGFSEQARSHYNAAPGGSLRDATTLGMDGKTVRGDGAGREVATSNSSQGRLNALQKTGDSRAVVYGTAGNASEQSGTSIFDPVLCELAYRWFCPPDGAVLDPFAGGSVRGIVAALLGRNYTGIDLSERQIEANRVQAADISKDKQPSWIVGDAKDAKALAPGEYDLIFTCPPYFDLELYSDDEHDLSNAGDYAAFLDSYRRIIAACVDMLKPDRFACIVVGDIRDKRGIYRNFPADTIAAFQDASAVLYNEAILVTAVGSLPIRVGRQFEAARKLGKTHQNVLVFLKGDAKKATEACGEVDVALPDMQAGTGDGS